MYNTYGLFVVELIVFYSNILVIISEHFKRVSFLHKMYFDLPRSGIRYFLYCLMIMRVL